MFPYKVKIKKNKTKKTTVLLGLVLQFTSCHISMCKQVKMTTCDVYCNYGDITIAWCVWQKIGQIQTEILSERAFKPKTTNQPNSVSEDTSTLGMFCNSVVAPLRS